MRRVPAPGGVPSPAPLLAALLVGLPLALAPAAARAQDDAASLVVQKYGCEGIKELQLSSTQEAMAFWAEEVVAGSQRDVAQGIVGRGHAADAILEIEDMVKFVEVAEELVRGDASAALRKASEWGLDFSATLVGGPMGAAVWSTLKTLGEFAADLNAEILQLNLSVLADVVERDPALRGPGAGEVLLDRYLAWGLKRSDDTQTIKLRGLLIDFANLEIQQSDTPFPSVRDWTRPEHRNRVRVAAQTLVRHARGIAEARQARRALERQVPGLKQELDTLRRFRSWAVFLDGVLCNADDGRTAACLAGAESAAALLPGAEAGVFRFDADRLARLEARLAALDGEVDAAGGAVEVELAGVRAACASAGGAGAGAEGQAVAIELESALRGIASRAEAACTASDPATAGAAAREARDAATRVHARRAAALADLAAAASGVPVPEPVDLAALERRMAGLAADARALLAEVRDSALRGQSTAVAAQRARGFLQACTGAAASIPQVAALRERVAVLEQRLADEVLPDAGRLGSLEGRLAGLQAFLLERRAAQRDGRACLATPAGGGSADSRALVARLEPLAAEADAAVARAETCARSAKASPEAGASPPGDGTGFDPSGLVGRPLGEAVGLVTAARLRPLPRAGSAAPTPDLAGRVESATLQGGEVVLVAYTAPIAAGRVPNVVGLGLREAHGAVSGAGLTPVVEMGDDAPTPARANTVASQHPAAGTEVRAGGDVTLTIYTQAGPPGRIVPSLVGLGVGPARDRLSSSELAMDPVFEVVAPGPDEQGRVYRQYPEPGVEVPRGVGVRVWVYRRLPGPAVVEHTREDERPLPYREPVDTYEPWEPEPVDTGPDPADAVAGFLEQMMRQQQRREEGEPSTAPCRPTGNSALDTVMGQIYGTDCEGEASSSPGGRQDVPELGRWGLEGGSSGTGRQSEDGSSTGPCKGRGVCRMCEGDSIGMPTACMHAIEADVEQQCGHLQYAQDRLADFFACQQQVIDSWEN
jgi:beta-lactam-binding protein with PASTA domain